MRNRIEMIDAFRAVFIGGVLVSHYLVRWAPPLNGAVDHYHYDYVYSPQWELGSLGPVLFFAISGLVISLTIKGCRDSLEFLFRRASRLWPAFVVCATITFVTMKSLNVPQMAISYSDYLLNLTMIPQILRASPADGAYWSILVELKFYGMVALFFWLMRERYWIGILGCAAVSAALEFIRPAFAAVIIAAYMPYFLLGIGLAACRFEHRMGKAIALIGAGLAMQALNWQVAYPQSALQIVVIVGTLGLVMLALFKGEGITYGPLPYIGRRSYSLYLIHQNLGVTLIGLAKLHGFPDFFAFAAALTTVWALTELVYRWIEVPAQQRLRIAYGYLRGSPKVSQPSPITSSVPFAPVLVDIARSRPSADPMAQEA